MRLLRRVVRGVWWLASACFAAMVACWQILLGTLRTLRGSSVLAFDFVKSRHSLKGGVLHCQRGHAIGTEGGVYQCGKCGFSYRGSIWLCGNPECSATITPYVDCPDCGLSVRNPYRWGRA